MTATTRDPARTHQGKPCRVCGGTERYNGRNDCADCCRRRAVERKASRARTIMPLPHKRESAGRRFIPAPVVKLTKAAPFAGILITRLPARFVGMTRAGAQKFEVEGFIQDFLFLWDAAQVPGLSHGDTGEMRWAINPAIAGEPNWYFVPTGVKHGD